MVWGLCGSDWCAIQCYFATVCQVVVHGLEEVPKTAFQRAGRRVICTYLSHPPLYCLFDCLSIHLSLLDFFGLYLTPLCTDHALPNQARAQEETIHKSFPHLSLILITSPYSAKLLFKILAFHKGNVPKNGILTVRVIFIQLLESPLLPHCSHKMVG